MIHVCHFGSPTHCLISQYQNQASVKRKVVLHLTEPNVFLNFNGVTKTF